MGVAGPRGRRLIERIVTARLEGTRIRETDGDHLRTIYQNPRVMMTLGGATLSDEVVDGFLAAMIEHWDRHGYGLFVLRTIGENAFVGYAGLRHVHVSGADEVEILYAVLPEFWGRGLTAEFSGELKRLALERFELPSVIAFTLPSNRRSQRVMEKIGLVYERDIVWRDRPHVLYRAGRETTSNLLPSESSKKKA